MENFIFCAVNNSWNLKKNGLCKNFQAEDLS